ncbi:peptidoglycan D,D-transpeptidase FtsI family protein [Desulfotignum balticum]|uniref:peptidoglycan D,D-transpeptidase FtsI family protein n=1 Tax=Desulfotignum balticum TaxID=115781 RepID=UPI0004091CB2|nr:penicillin-binding protein 2 [Desulfotignum balticum]
MPDPGQKKIVNRIRFIQGVLILILTGLGIKSFDIQILKADEYARRAENGYSRHLTIKGERGRILDRHWNKLGATLDALTVIADPLRIEAPVKTARALVPLLEMDVEDLVQKFSRNSRYALIAENISPDLALKVRALNLPGIYFQKSFKRFYPNRELAAQVLGFTGKEDVGLEGLEFKYNDVLEGHAVTIRVRRDGTGRILDIDRQKQAELRGNDIVLTLDKKIQLFTETALEETVLKHQAKSGMALVMRPATGELLAMAHYPRFNPNNYQEFDPALFRNRIVTDSFEPGSTLKVFTAAAALETGMAPSTIFFCENGRYRIGKYTVKDTHPHDWLTINHIIAYSSNIGAVKIAEKIGRQTLHDYLSRFGFGNTTQIDSPGETTGTLMPPERWTKIDTGAISFGQGISVSAIQLVSGISTIANNGQVMKPMLVKKIVSNTGEDLKVFHPTPVHQAVSPQTAARVKHMMALAVQENGTGTKAALAGYNVCGKTGTAQKVVQGQKGYAKNTYTSVFAGFAPLQNPQLAVLVVVDEPRNKYYGGDVAAPAFKNILAQSFNYLSIPPAAGSMVAAVTDQGESL